MATAGKSAGATAQGDAWMSIVEAARVLGESRLRVLSRAVKGELVAQQFAGRTCVLRESVERVKATK